MLTAQRGYQTSHGSPNPSLHRCRSCRLARFRDQNRSIQCRHMGLLCSADEQHKAMSCKHVGLVSQTMRLWLGVLTVPDPHSRLRMGQKSGLGIELRRAARSQVTDAKLSYVAPMQKNLCLLTLLMIGQICCRDVNCVARLTIMRPVFDPRPPIG